MLDLDGLSFAVPRRESGFSRDVRGSFARYAPLLRNAASLLRFIATLGKVLTLFGLSRKLREKALDAADALDEVATELEGPIPV